MTTTYMSEKGFSCLVGLTGVERGRLALNMGMFVGPLEGILRTPMVELKTKTQNALVCGEPLGVSSAILSSRDTAAP